jgi:FkbM family methyltransferase
MKSNSNYQWLLKVRPAFVATFLKKVLMIKRFFVETTYGRFYIDPISNFGNAILSDNAYEQDVIDSLLGILQKEDVFVDLGANEGFFSILASKIVGKQGKVISIEPQSRLQSVLFRNISENNAYNINIFQRAISDSDGIATISLAPDTNSGSSGIFRATKYKNPTEDVLQTTLSCFINLLNIDKIKLMKIDIESFEYEAILGSKSIFEQNIIENIALELHPSILDLRGKSGLDILEFLHSVGYEENKNYRNLVLSKKT